MIHFYFQWIQTSETLGGIRLQMFAFCFHILPKDKILLYHIAERRNFRMMIERIDVANSQFYCHTSATQKKQKTTDF